jgi:amidase
LRIGVRTTRPGSGEQADDDCVAAVHATARALESLGHHVEEAAPAALDDPARFDTFLAIWSSNAAFGVHGWGQKLGRELGPDDVEPVTWFLVERGRKVSAVDFMDAVNVMQVVCRKIVAWWDDFDLLLTPTLGEPPPELGVLADTENPLAGFARTGPWTAFTPWVNQTGQPAISLPVHVNGDGLPVGVQLVGAFAREDLLLRVAAQLEEALPWSQRRPAVHA